MHQAACEARSANRGTGQADGDAGKGLLTREEFDPMKTKLLGLQT
jgi:hypothetical protein